VLRETPVSPVLPAHPVSQDQSDNPEHWDLPVPPALLEISARPETRALLVLVVFWVAPETQAHRDQSAQWVQLALKDRKVCKVERDLLDRLVLLEIRDRLGSQGLRVIQVVQVMQDHWVPLVLLAQAVTPDRQEDQAHRDSLELKDHRDLRVKTVRRDPQEQLVHRVIRAAVVRTEIQDSPELQALRDRKDLKDQRAPLDLTARQEIVELTEILAHRDHRVRKVLPDRLELRGSPDLWVPLESRVIQEIRACRALRG